MYALLHEDGRNIPALILMPALTLGRMTLGGRSDLTDEYFSRPFSTESLRWRLEAMLIRIDKASAGGGVAPSVRPGPAADEPNAAPAVPLAEAPAPAAAGPVADETLHETSTAADAAVEMATPAEVAPPVEAAPVARPVERAPVDAASVETKEVALPEPARAEPAETARPRTGHVYEQPHYNGPRGKLVIVFNPKGGVGKTTVSINVGSAMQLRKNRHVLLIDCDTVTGHVASSLGMTVPRTLADAWRDDLVTGTNESIAQVATTHSSGVDVVVLSQTPFHTEVLEPERVAQAVAAALASYDLVILDLHPDFGPLNLALFGLADRIIVPVTPDMPCILAAVQFREVATALEMRDRLLLVINRSNSGILPSRVERTVGLPVLARIRSGGLLFVRASDEGKSAAERFPNAKAVVDIDRLTDRLLAALGEGGDRRFSGQPRGRISGSVRDFIDRLGTQR
jgi:cellulose biosynthesis protein BcsQ